MCDILARFVLSEMHLCAQFSDWACIEKLNILQFMQNDVFVLVHKFLWVADSIGPQRHQKTIFPVRSLFHYAYHLLQHYSWYQVVFFISYHLPYVLCNIVRHIRCHFVIVGHSLSRSWSLARFCNYGIYAVSIIWVCVCVLWIFYLCFVSTVCCLLLFRVFLCWFMWRQTICLVQFPECYL